MRWIYYYEANMIKALKDNCVSISILYYFCDPCCATFIYFCVSYTRMTVSKMSPETDLW